MLKYTNKSGNELDQNITKAPKGEADRPSFSWLQLSVSPFQGELLCPLFSMALRFTF